MVHEAKYDSFGHGDRITGVLFSVRVIAAGNALTMAIT